MSDIMTSRPLRIGILLSTFTLSIFSLESIAEAGWPQRKARKQTVVVTPTSQVRPYGSRPPLGTFNPSPYLFVRGNGPVGGGYSAMGQYGNTTLALEGPLSPLREMAAPVLVYNRGYDGVVRPSVETSFSTPNLPRISPVVYPTRANYVYGFRRANTPPWWDSGMTWIDQN